jgi:hypothetical protein
LQVGHAPNEISILYRAFLAAILLYGWCKYKKFSLQFRPQDHLFLFALGLSMFSIHYLFVYHATNFVVSGVIAVVASGTGFLSIVNNFIFFRTKPTLNVILVLLLGLVDSAFSSGMNLQVPPYNTTHGKALNLQALAQSSSHLAGASAVATIIMALRLFLL